MPRTRKTLSKFEPMTEPMASAAWPRLAATMAAMSSGSDVPMATTVSPSMRSDIPNSAATPRAPLTNWLEPNTKRPSPATVIRTAHSLDAATASASGPGRADGARGVVGSSSCLAETVKVTTVNKMAQATSAMPSPRERWPSRRHSGTAMAEPSKIGISRLMSRLSMSGGRSRAVIPRIRLMLAAQEPITVPSAMGCTLSSAALVDTASSGAEVPYATTVKPITSGLTPKALASPAEPRIIHSAPR